MRYKYTITKEGGETEEMEAMSWKKLFKSLLVLVMEKESKPVVFTHCVFCGTMPAPDQWSTQIENACFDCA